MSFKVVSTFSGCGGSSLGYKMAGAEVTYAVEFNKLAACSYSKNFPDTKLYFGDITKLNPQTILQETGLEPLQLDILDGSPPCQGFSMAGSRTFTDTRNYLFYAYSKLLQVLKPKVFIMENVAGMIRGKMKLIFTDVLKEFKRVGYTVSARLMDAAYFGVAQHRRRLIFIGVRNDLNVLPTHPKAAHLPISCREALNGYIIEDEKAGLTDRQTYYWYKVKKGQNFSTVHPKKFAYNQIRLHPDKPAPTLTREQHCYYHWDEPRQLTENEYKAFFSYPLNFKFCGTQRNAKQQMGNSVPPLFMKAMADHVNKEILQKIP